MKKMIIAATLSMLSFNASAAWTTTEVLDSMDTFERAVAHSQTISAKTDKGFDVKVSVGYSCTNPDYGDMIVYGLGGVPLAGWQTSVRGKMIVDGKSQIVRYDYVVNKTLRVRLGGYTKVNLEKNLLQKASKIKLRIPLDQDFLTVETDLIGSTKAINNAIKLCKFNQLEAFERDGLVAPKLNNTEYYSIKL